MTLTAVQIWILGLVATVVVLPISKGLESLITSIMKSSTPVDLGRGIKTVLVAIFAGIAAYIIYPHLLPAFPVLAPVTSIETFLAACRLIWAWLGDNLTATSPFVGTATLIYNIILSQLADPTKRAALVRSLTGILK